MASSITLVTALFDLGAREGSARRSIDEYLQHTKWVMQLPVPIVIYAESSILPKLLEQRRGLEALTLTKEITLEDSKYYPYLGRIKASRSKNPIRNANPIKDTPNYCVVNWTKFDLLQRVATENPFKTTHLAWIDAGLSHVADVGHFLEDRLLQPTDRIKLLVLRLFHKNDLLNLKDYLSILRGLVGSGYVSGSVGNIQLLCQRVQTTVDNLISEFAPSEKQLMPLLDLMYPEMFEHYYGDYKSTFTNYRTVRGDWGHLLWMMITGRNSNYHAKVVKVGTAIFESTHVPPPDILNRMYQECVSSAFYVDRALAVKLHRMWSSWLEEHLEFPPPPPEISEVL